MKCRSNTCQEEVTHRVHWPSGPIDTCGACAQRWSGIAQAMGVKPLIVRIDIMNMAEMLLGDDEVP